MPEKKKKRDLIATFESIERFHRRRSELVLHAVLSLTFQAAMWLNWYSSYGAVGRGFEDTFFTDRLSITLALVLTLVGHLALVYLRESRDRLVVQALRRHQQDLADYEADDEPEAGADDEIGSLWRENEKLEAERKW